MWDAKENNWFKDYGPHIEALASINPSPDSRPVEHPVALQPEIYKRSHANDVFLYRSLQRKPLPQWSRKVK
jgi:hypothetical protein